MIRPATAEDVAEIVRMERLSETAPHWPLEEYKRLLAGHPGPTRHVLLVAVEAAVLEGFAAGSALDAHAELESIVVRQDRQRRGVGRQLCRAVMAWARLSGAHTLTLEVRAGSAGARQLYAGLGFMDVGRRPGYYAEPVEDAILMRCPLGEDAAR